MKPTITYVPGVCNIGPEEIRRRKAIGWTGLVAAIALLAILFAIHANPWWRAFVFLPAVVSAMGFLQARFGFCSAYGQKGVSGMTGLGAVQPVTDAASLAKDRNTANRIVAYAAIVGIAVTALAVLAQ